MTTLHFLGAAGTVTGSAYLVATSSGALLVDCGMFQGPKSLQALNYRQLPVAPGDIAAVILTHAHIDHSGLFPRLVAGGFRRRAYATQATCDLLRWLLPDSGAIQEAEVERLNRRNARRDVRAAQPLYTAADAEVALGRLAPQESGAWFAPLPQVRARFHNAGHILGAVSVELAIAQGADTLRVLFSGDLGPRNKSLQFDPLPPDAADFLVLESTYGDRVRPHVTEDQRRAALADEVVAALIAGGNLLIPAFAVERTQELLLDLARLVRDDRIPPAPVYLDSPLAQRATAVFERHVGELELPPGGGGAPFRSANFHVAESVAQSKAIAAVERGAIIIAGSGMCDAGRIKHHLKDHLWRGDSTVLFVGYQAPGTLGQVIRSGARTVRIHGEEIAVRARIRTLDLYSGHADQSELCAWATPLLPHVGHVFLTHGEPRARAALGDALIAAGLPRERLAAPAIGAAFTLRAASAGGRADAVPAPSLAGAPDLEAARAITAGRDWHNEYAEAALALRRSLADAPDDDARRKLLAHVRGVLGVPAPPA